jgi:uncharacterized secreted protein with C-terminal beta-propeller domain
VALALLAAACTTGDTGPTGTTPGSRTTRTAGPMLFAGSGLQTFDACENFLDYVISHALDLVGPYGLEGLYGWGGPVALATAVEEFAMPAAVDAARAEPLAGVDYSTTNVQELGVDEPDFVKTDGRRILAIAQGRLHYIDVTGPNPRLVSTLRLDDGWGIQMLLSGDRVLLMRTAGPGEVRPAIASEIVDPGIIYPSQVTVISEVDISDPERMEIVRTLYLDGAYVSARLVGDVARIVIRSLPTGLPFVFPEGGGLRAERIAEEKNREIVRNSTIENWIPYYVLEDHQTGRTTEGTLLDCRNAAHPKEFSGLGMLSVLTVDLSAGLSPASGVGVLAAGDTVYASQDSLYVATNRWIARPLLQSGDAEKALEGMTTQIHRFDISNQDQTVYRASGEVEGFLLSQWSMSEFNGHLRVATTSQPPWWGRGPERRSESFVTVLAESNGELVEVGRVGGLGKGEQIYAVRFIDDVGYVVTFRQVDPLYVIDLSEPRRPEVVGELEILGYSAYLHPLGDGLLLGIGQDATAQGRTLGTQIAVFDVSDPSNPRRLFKRTIDDGTSEVEWDQKAFLYWPANGLSVVPIQKWSWDGHTGTEDWFSGALGFTVDRERGIEEVGVVTHQMDGKNNLYEWGAQIRRTLVIGDALYTVSELGIKASDLHTLDERAWLAFDAG